MLASSLSVILAISGWAAWISKEIISLLLKRAVVRSGKHEFLIIRSGVFLDALMENGQFACLEYHPKYPNLRLDKMKTKHFRLEFEGELLNDSDVQIIYKNPIVEIWGIEGLRMIHKSPRVLIQTADGFFGTDDKIVSIIVPPHGTTRIMIQLLLPMDYKIAVSQVNKDYSEAVALLRITAMNGRPREFRICTTSFAGKNLVVWPERCKFPIFNEYSLNEREIRAGFHPQKIDSVKSEKLGEIKS